MNRLDRLTKLRDLFVLAGGEIKTRKKLHKMIYLLQESRENFDQDYKYHFYGVFSQTLASDLDFAVQDNVNLLSQEPEAQGFVYSLNESTVLESRFLEPMRENVGNLIAELSKQDPRLLEALSTIVYLNRSQDEGEDLKSKLKELKPDLDNYFDQAFQLAEKYYEIKI